MKLIDLVKIVLPPNSKTTFTNSFYAQKYWPAILMRQAPFIKWKVQESLGLMNPFREIIGIEEAILRKEFDDRRIYL